MIGLNDKQELFCQEYLKDLNGTKAATRANYSEATAQEQASRLLSNVMVQERIAELQKEAADRNKIQVDQVLQELKALAFWDIAEFLDRGNQIKDISKLARDKAKPVTGIKTKVVKRTVGKKKYESVVTELKLSDKISALEKLGRHLGMFMDQLTIKTTLESVLTKYVENGTINDEGLRKLAELVMSYQKNNTN
jgi:phage terminase small subunit